MIDDSLTQEGTITSDSLNLVTYGEEREAKKMSTSRAVVILIKSSLGLAFFTFQLTIGKSGLILSLFITVLQTVIVSYATWRCCRMANMIEEMYESVPASQTTKGPRRIRTYEDLCRHSKYPVSLTAVTMSTTFLANLFAVFVFMTNACLFVE